MVQIRKQGFCACQKSQDGILMWLICFLPRQEAGMALYFDFSVLCAGKHPQGKFTNWSFIVSVHCCAAAKHQQEDCTIGREADDVASSFHLCEQKEPAHRDDRNKDMMDIVFFLCSKHEEKLFQLWNNNNKWKVHLMLISFCLFFGYVDQMLNQIEANISWMPTSFSSWSMGTYLGTGSCAHFLVLFPPSCFLAFQEVAVGSSMICDGR